MATSTISGSQHVLVTVKVPPGFLNFLLGSDDLDRPVLEGFEIASRADSKQRGAVELRNRVPLGSVLVGVNELDFMRANLSSKAVNDVLQQTSHLPRTLKFHVPVRRESNLPLKQQNAPRKGPPPEEEGEEEKEEPEEDVNGESDGDMRALKTAQLLRSQDGTLPLTGLLHKEEGEENNHVSTSNMSSVGKSIREIHVTEEAEAASVGQDQQSDGSASLTLSEFVVHESPTSSMTSSASSGLVAKNAQVVVEKARMPLHESEKQGRLAIPIEIAPITLPKTLSFGTMARLAETRHFDSDDSSVASDDCEDSFDATIQASSESDNWNPCKANTCSMDTFSSCSSCHPEELSPQKPQQLPVVPGSMTSNQFDHDVSVVIKDGATYVTAITPPGPLGLSIDGGQLKRAVVMGFVRLSDGSKSALERLGHIVPGSVIVKINGEDISHLPLNAVGLKLNELSCRPRTITFRLPSKITRDEQRFDMLAPSAKQCTQTLSFLIEDLDKRRKIELAIIMHYDRQVLSRHDCWFCIDAKWMARWADFVCRDGPEPGPISNETLLQENWRKMLAHDAPGRADTARKGLVLMKDYRVVVPFVWCLLAELHGIGEAPLLARYLMDIYAEALCDGEVNKVLKVSRPKSVVLAKYVRDKCLVSSSRKR